MMRMQPTFSFHLDSELDESIAKLRKGIQESDFRDDVIAAGTCFEFRIAKSEQRFWSPHLSVQLSSMSDGALVFCRFSPRPEIWTMFMAIYAVVLCLMIASVIFAFVQWRLGDSPLALIFVPVGAMAISLLHFASLVGQHWSQDQMDVLRGRLELAAGHPQREESSTCVPR